MGGNKCIIRLDRDWDGYIYVTEVGEGRVVKFAPTKKPSLGPSK